jgi:hypothetical protein
MVFELVYEMGGTPGQRREDRFNISAASSVELMYSCFVGNVALGVGGVDLSANFGWIPLLHFANNVDLILYRLAADETKVYHFTESEDWISFSEHGGDVEVRCSYAPNVVGVADREDARKAARLAGLTLVQGIEHEHSEIHSNSIFADIASRMRGSAGPA